MKSLVFLSFIVLLAACTDAKQPLKGSQHSFARALQARAISGACSIDCSNLGLNAEDWVVSIAQLGLTVIYVKQQAALAFVNFNLNIAVVVINGLIGIFDISKGVGLLINKVNGLAKIVSGLATIPAFFIGASINLVAGVGALAGILIQGALNLTFNLVNGVFQLGNSLFSLLAFGAQAIVSFIALKANFDLALLNNFTAFFTNFIQFAASAGFAGALGIVNLVAGIVGGGAFVIGGALAAIASIIVGSAAISASVAFTLVYNLFFFADAILSGAIVAVKLVDLAWQFIGAGGKLLLTVPLSGLILVDGLVRGTLANFASLGFGFSAGGLISFQTGGTVNTG